MACTSCVSTATAAAVFRLSLAVLVLLVLLHARCATAQLFDTRAPHIPWDARRIEHSFLHTCPCSPSSRGYDVTTLRILERELIIAQKRVRDLMQTGAVLTTAREVAAARVIESMGHCFKKYGAEACINADAALRQRPAHVQLCTRDAQTGRNVYAKELFQDFKVLRPCNERKQFESTPAQRGLPGKREKSRASSHDHGHDHGHDHDHGDHSAHTTPKPSGKVKGSAADARATEGCVDVAHLANLKLQHRHHLWRRVLCANGFCATPNHAVIVQGKWTSMKKLCAAEWTCSAKWTWVNNLAVTGNCRAKVLVDNGIEIVLTPYDLRFPRICIWLLQILADVAALVFRSVQIALTVSLALFGLAACTHMRRKQLEKVPVRRKDVRALPSSASLSVCRRPASLSTSFTHVRSASTSTIMSQTTQIPCVSVQ